MPTPRARPPLRERLFARFMAAGDEESFARYREKKAALLGPLRGRVLELGPGTGVNLPFLDHSVQWAGIEPNQAMHAHLNQKAREVGLDVEIIPGLLPQAGFEPDSVDAVISTLVLCSVPAVEQTLAEVLRVLRPGGRFVFLEHVIDRPGSPRRWVQRLAPYTPWRYFSNGCDPGRDLGAAIAAAGFSSVQCESYHQEGPGWVLAVTRPHIFGSAIK